MTDKTGCSIVLTGATGFLGAFLMAGLLEQGYSITVLGRSSNDMRLVDRLSGLVRWFGITDPGKKLGALEADFSKKRLGLDDAVYGRLCAAASKIIHCASDTCFVERHRARVMATNVNNLSALLGLAADARAEHLYYISTAYAAGKCEGLCMESPITTSCFTNVYEESKAQAEGIIGRFCENSGVPLSILRPSIVYGHSKTGNALKFNALYYPVKSLSCIRDIFMKDIVEHWGQRSRRWGIRLGDDGILYLPLTTFSQPRNQKHGTSEVSSGYPWCLASQWSLKRSSCCGSVGHISIWPSITMRSTRLAFLFCSTLPYSPSYPRGNDVDSGPLGPARPFCQPSQSMRSPAPC
jgi:nucleoside-diphosphate-sugar epimerase